jgi:drug/metabolite transporter (DMT)-like permease
MGAMQVEARLVGGSAAPIATRPAIPRRGIALCIISATSFGFAAVFAKEAFAAGTSVPALMTARFGLAALAFWAVVVRRRPLVPPLRVIAVCIGLGAIGYALQSGFYFGALTKVDATVVGQVLYVYPAIVVGLALIRRKEKTERRTLLALLCTAVGLALLMGSGGVGGAHVAAGMLMALGAAGTYAVYITVAHTLPVDLDVYLLCAIVCTAAALSVSCFGLTTQSMSWPATGGSWPWIVLLALVSTVIPIGTFLAGLRIVGPSIAAILSCMEPVVTAATGIVIYGEHFGVAQVVGGVAVLSSIVVLQRR